MIIATDSEAEQLLIAIQRARLGKHELSQIRTWMNVSAGVPAGTVAQWVDYWREINDSRL